MSVGRAVFRVAALFALAAAAAVVVGADEAIELQLDEGVVREPPDGVLVYSTTSNILRCSPSKEEGDEPTGDIQWYRLADGEENLVDGQSSEEFDVTDLVKAEVGGAGFKVRCRIGSEGGMAEFAVQMGNTTHHRLPFKVKKFDKSYEIDVQQDMQFKCVVVNRTTPLEDVMRDIDVKWFKWDETNDLSFRPDKEQAHIAPNCSVESMADSKWIEIEGTEMEEGDIEPHIQIFKKSTMKLEDARYSDRRGYKCVAYNVSDPEKCSESMFFIRVKDKYAALWPFLGIVAEVILLCVLIFLCERSKSSKDPEEEEEQNGKAMGVQVGGGGGGGGGNSSVRHRRS